MSLQIRRKRQFLGPSYWHLTQILANFIIKGHYFRQKNGVLIKSGVLYAGIPYMELALLLGKFTAYITIRG